MTLEVAIGEVLDAEVLGEDYLDDLASVVRREYRRSCEALGEAVDAYFEVGRALVLARQALPSNEAFGAWFRSEEFGFNQQWAHVLRTAAEHEPAVRSAITSQLVNGRSPNIEKAVKQVRALTAGGSGDRPDKARRSPLPDAAQRAGWELRKAIERIERVITDDRFSANKAQVAAQLRGHLTYAAETIPGLVDLLTAGPQEDQ